MGVPTPPPPNLSDKGSLKVGEKMPAGHRATLARLARKAADALPGMTGSVVSWDINLPTKTAGWLAENLWATILAVGGLLLAATRDWLVVASQPSRQQPKCQ